MESYLVRKRPFADHPPPPKKSRTSTTQRHAAAAAAPSIDFVPASSAAAAAAASSSSSSHSSGGSSRWRPQPHLKQMALTQMSKVTVLDEVSAMHSFLQSAFDRADWTAVADVLKQLRDVFISKVVLEKTGIGRTLTNIKNATKQQQQATQETDEPAAAASAANQPADGGPDADEEERLLALDRPNSIDLTDGPGLTRSSNGGNGSRSAASSAAAQAEATQLALELLGVWRAQVKKEMAAEAASGASGLPALDFGQYSTIKNRTRTYKELYFLITQRDEKESPAQQLARRQACQPLLARDPPAAAVASELEQILFRLHRNRHVQQRLNSSNSELLSAAPAHPHREDESVTQEPPGYAPHARNMLQTLRMQFSKLHQLRRWVGAEEQPVAAAAGAGASANLAATRRAELEQIVNSTKAFSA